MPHPIISWRHRSPNGTVTRVEENSRRLLVEITDKDQAGHFECLANNGVGEPAVAGVNVRVNCE